MHLHQGTTEQFTGDAVRARLANQLAERFFEELRYKPAPSEVTSWHNSLSAMSNGPQLADLRDQGILGGWLVDHLDPSKQLQQYQRPRHVARHQRALRGGCLRFGRQCAAVVGHPNHQLVS
jgi:hypothetical protein